VYRIKKLKNGEGPTKGCRDNNNNNKKKKNNKNNNSIQFIYVQNLTATGQLQS
jgi:hypothetical protein